MASVSIRYARAFADVVIDLKLDSNKIRQELRSVVEIVGSSSDLRNVWKSPAVPHEQKIKLLDAIAQRARLQTTVRNFMAVLIEHGRTNALPVIARQFEQELNQRLGFVEADVVSARELSPEQKALLEEQIGKLTGRKVRAQYGMDQQILGGAVVKVGSTIYDGSLRGQLRRMKEQLSAG